MAFPVILIDSTSGSDSAASGAGPATAVTGSAGVSSASGLVVVLDGSPDISGVATDGSHVIYFADATAGNRNFGKITATANSGTPTAQVTVADAFGANLTKAWAIGGKRASLTSTTSLKLCSNNGAAGDLMPGWVAEFQSAHTETTAGTIDTRRAGDTTSGPIIIRGKAGAATRPIITESTDGNMFAMRGIYQQFRGFEVRCSGGTTASVAFTAASALSIIEDVKCSNSSNKFWKFFSDNSAAGGRIISCEIGNTVSFAITCTGAGNVGGLEIINCWIYNSGGNALNLASNSYFNLVVKGNDIYNTTGHGILYDNSRTDALGGCVFEENTIDLCSAGKDAINIVTSALSLQNLVIVNNILSNNGGYGIDFAAAGHTDALLAAYAPFIRGNNTFNNTSGAYKSNTAGYTNSNCPWASGDPGLNPTYASASTGNFMLGTPLKAQGWPLGGTLAVGTGSLTYSYVEPGAAQRQEAGGSAGMLFVPNLEGT